MEDAPLKGGALTRMILKNPVQFKVISFPEKYMFLENVVQDWTAFSLFSISCLS